MALFGNICKADDEMVDRLAVAAKESVMNGKSCNR